MAFQFVYNKDGIHKFSIIDNCYHVNYYTENEMEAIYPHGGYEVVGEIGNVARISHKSDDIDTGEGRTIPVFPRGTIKKPFEQVIGYAEIGEKTYVAIVNSILPKIFQGSLSIEKF